MKKARVDPTLVLRAQQGDADARSTVLASVAAWLPRAVALRYPVHAGRDDLCQDVLLQIHLGLDSVQHPEHFTAWAYGVLRNCTAARFRASRVRREVLAADEDLDTRAHQPSAGGGAGGLTPEDLASRREDCQRGMEALASLSEPLREIYALYVEEYSITEIATMLGLPRGTVASRLRKARSLLLKRLARFRTGGGRPGGRRAQRGG